MSLPSEGLKDILLTHGFIFGGSADWAIYLGRRPDKPDATVAMYDTAGNTPNPRWLIDYPSVQIIVRGDVNDYQAARLKAVEVKKHLLGHPSSTIGGDRWVHFNMVGDIGFIGHDQNNRPEFSMNFNLIIEPAETDDDHRIGLEGVEPPIPSGSHFTAEFTEEFE